MSATKEKMTAKQSKEMQKQLTNTSMMMNIKDKFEKLVLKYSKYYENICMWRILVFIISALVVALLGSILKMPFFLCSILVLELLVIYTSFQLDEYAEKLLDEDE
jgi:hypothetical protein